MTEPWPQRALKREEESLVGESVEETLGNLASERLCMKMNMTPGERHLKLFALRSWRPDTGPQIRKFQKVLAKNGAAGWSVGLGGACVTHLIAGG